MASIGVGDGSRCWAGWLGTDVHDENRDPSSDHRDEEAPRTDKAPLLKPHLFVTPFPPSTWPFLIRLVVRVTSDPGSVGKVTREISRLNLNIVSAEVVQSGHQHSICSFILDPACCLEDELKQIRAVLGNEDEVKTRLDIARNMHGVVRAVINACHHIKDTLYQELQTCLWEPRISAQWRELFRDGKRSIADISIPEPVSCYWIQWYFYTWFARSPAASDLEMRYSAKEQLLICDDWPGGHSFCSQLEREPEEPSACGIVLVDHKSMSARFMFDAFMDPGFSAPQETKVAYSIQDDGHPPAPPRAIGTLDNVIQQYGDKRILHVSNRIMNARAGNNNRVSSESGAFSIAVVGQSLGSFGPGACGRQRYAETSATGVIDNRARGERGVAETHGEVLHVGARELRPWSIFLSTYADWLTGAGAGAADVRTGLKLACEELGFRTVLVDYYSLEREYASGDSDLTIEQRVRSELSGCTCLLQILPREFLRSPNDPNRLRWMFYERGFASAAGKPKAVCIDTDDIDGPTRSEWTDAMRINEGEFLYRFCMRDGTRKIVDDIMAAVRCLYGAMMQRLHS